MTKGDEQRRRLRAKNLAVAFLLLGLVVLIYWVAMVKMGGG
ncbi:MAG: hypothetical protein R3D28_08770 [Geminicoccaceae bacterium]|jgi:hypothetical protein|nr:hypothetical protein [Geminicoccaceae bacterium]